jgi:translocation and assembly module TamB
MDKTNPTAAPPPGPAVAPPDPPAAKPRRGWLGKTLLGLAAAGLVLGLLLPAGALLALLHWPGALPWLAQQLPGLQVSGLQGTLDGRRVAVQSLDWQLPAAAGRLQIQGLVVQGGHITWLPHPGALLGLQLDSVSADRLQFTSGPPSGTPLAAPTQLRLPLALQIDKLQLAQLQIDKLPVIERLSAGLSLGADQGALHRISALTLDWQQAHLQADLQIGSAAPLALQAKLQASRQAPAVDLAAPVNAVAALGWDATLALHGPLARLTAAASLRGRTGPTQAPVAALDASASLLPFATWPLGDLTLSTDKLDLAALLPGLPRTALAGSISVKSNGLNRPATLDATLDNRLPGAWDSGQLPLQRLVLKASAKPSQPEHLTLERFVLTLADASGSAGQISGQGLWTEASLALDLQVQALQPARLHRQAAALVLTGPVLLKFSGLPALAQTAPAAAPTAAPQLVIDSHLKGRRLDGSGEAVELRLVGSGGADQFSISQAQAHAGLASAELQLDGRSDPAGWRLRGKAKLDKFDPRPWWRGPADSAWQRGPHRVDAQADIDLLWHGAPANTAVQGPATTPVPLIERWLRAADGNAKLSLSNSLLAGVPLSAALQLRSTGLDAEISAQLELAGNRVSLQGLRAVKPSADHWQLQVQAPALAALLPLGRLAAELAPESAAFWPRAGNLDGQLTAKGRWPALRTEGELHLQNLASAAGALQNATLSWQTGENADAPLALKLQAKGLVSGDKRLDALAATVSGSLRNHQLQLRIDSPVKPPAWTESLLGSAGTGTRLQADGRGSWTLTGGTTPAGPTTGPGTAPTGAQQSLWRLQDLQLQGGARDALGGSRDWLAAKALAIEVKLGPDLQPLALTLAPGRVQLLGTAINWREARWLAPGPAGPIAPTGKPGQAPVSGHSQLVVQGELERFDVAAVLARAQPAMGWGGQLTVGGRFDIRANERVDAEVVLERLSGDLSLTDELGSTQSLGMTDLRLALTVHDGLWQFAQGVAGRNMGEMAGAQVLRTTADRYFPPADTPLQGVLESNVANLGIWGTWVPPGWRLTGKLHTSASFGGTLGAPEVRGEMLGSGLGARNLLQGVNLADGELALTLAGDTARIDKFVFKGGDGQLILTGNATLGAKPSASLQLTAERFRLLGRIDRRLVASGSAELQLDSQRLQLDGSFTVDEGLIDLSSSDAPGLDADVQVRRAGAAASASPTPAATVEGPVAAPAPLPLRQAQVTLKINLGQKLRLKGHGLDTGLRGDLMVTSPQGKLALRGQVRTEGGTVTAYGQKLEVERGVVTFVGPLDNPQLDVLALRPNLDVRVGVRVAGPAQNPRIRLYSEPEMSDYDKLSWLVLGRGPDGLGRSDSALLQGAALALLSGEGQSPTGALLEGIGLTDFSLRQSEGDTRETIVSLGRQISRNWYVGYERSVNATTGTWQLIYRLAQRFTLRAQSGGENALDVIWSWRW